MRRFFGNIVASLFLVAVAGCLRVHLPKAEIKSPGEKEVFSWGKAVEGSLRNHPDLLQARAQIESAARDRDSAAGDYLPSVDGGMDRSRSRGTGTAAMKDSLSFDITASQNLFDGLNTTGNFLAARKRLESSKLAYRDTSASVRLRLRTAFVQVLEYNKLLDVNRRIASRRHDNAEMIRLRYEAGRENLGSALRAGAIASQADFDVRQTERQIDSKSILLGREIGGDFYLPVQIEGDLETLVLGLNGIKPDFVGLAEQTPQVRKFIRIAEAFKAAVISAQSGVWPKVDGAYNYGYTGAKESQLRDNMLLGLTVTVPFFNGGKNIAAIRKARADYEAALQAARSVRDARVAELADGWALFRDAAESVEVQREFLKANRERADIVRAEYTSGLANFQDFDISEQEITDTEKNFVRSMALALIQKANWEYLKGETLEDAKDAN
ncbi:MAG TPA: TolC family protein [Candidatus Omnitrophota bacterium]|nr:TolC family protein [Candidatus Omnitrophota bacterium]